MYGVPMNKRSNIAKIEKSKEEALFFLQKTEASLGQFVLEKKDKTISKDIFDSYASFATEIDSFYALQESIQSLDLEYTAIKKKIFEEKALKDELEKDEHSLYVQMGQSLFEHYTPLIADVFGKVYTSVCVEDRKIAEAKEKESLYLDEKEEKGVISRIVSSAKVGVTKAHIEALVQKRNQLLLNGAKSVIDSGVLAQLVETKKIDSNMELLFETFTATHKELKELEANAERLSLNANAIKSSLEKAGVTTTVQRRLSAIDKVIHQKHSEKDVFCAKVGHEYAFKYVSPDGEILVDFPKGLEEFLLEIQKTRYIIVSLSRQIEIENISVSIEKNETEHKILCEKKEANIQKINKINDENKDIDVKLQENSLHKNDLEKKLSVLKKEEMNLKIETPKGKKKTVSQNEKPLLKKTKK